MKFVQTFALSFIVFLCLNFAYARRNKEENSETEIEQRRQSLLDSADDDDNGGADNPTAKPGQSNPAETPKDVRSDGKSKSRHITLPPDYNKLEIPRRPNLKAYFENKFGPDFEFNEDEDADFGSLQIELDVKVRNIRDVDEIDEEITVELDFIAKWMDAVILFENKDIDPLELLANKSVTAGIQSLDPAFLKQIWKPDIFIENVVSITRPELITKPVRLLFSPAGYVVFSTRVTVKMDCEMEFHYYPADTQSCIFKIRSYSYTTKDLNITWDVGGPFLMDRNEHNFDMKLDFLESYELVEAEGLVDDDYSETYTILQFQIQARRKLSYHLIQTYLPSAFFIIITWLSFLVPATMVEARIGISMTTLLTLTAMFSSVRENTPIVSYVKAIDIWMVGCIFFVFITLLEFSVLTWRRHLGNNTNTEDSNSSNGSEPMQVNVGIGNKMQKYQYDPLDLTEKPDEVKPDTMSATIHLDSQVDKFLRGYQEKDIEKYGFRAFSLLFVLFNVIYWPWLLLSSEYFTWDVDLAYNVDED